MTKSKNATYIDIDATRKKYPRTRQFAIHFTEEEFEEVEGQYHSDNWPNEGNGIGGDFARNIILNYCRKRK